MIPLPKPRGFWDYTLFAFVMTAALLFLFWLEASDGARWVDATLAFAAAVLSVLAFGLIFGAIYADAYLLHRWDITSSRLRHDVVLASGLSAVMLWFLRRRRSAGRQLL
jgi:hypothetical protein